MANPIYHNFPGCSDIVNRSLEDYLMRGYEPGSFLTAVLANDLFGAVGRADGYNKQNLNYIVQASSISMPIGSYGSYDHVHDWVGDKHGCRSRYVDFMEKERMMDILSGKHDPKIKVFIKG